MGQIGIIKLVARELRSMITDSNRMLLPYTVNLLAIFNSPQLRKKLYKR